MLDAKFRAPRWVDLVSQGTPVPHMERADHFSMEHLMFWRRHCGQWQGIAAVGLTIISNPLARRKTLPKKSLYPYHSQDFMIAPLPSNETKRLAALHRYQILDTPAEQAFDDFAFLASTLCGTPIALMTLVDSNRQWFKARVGLAVTETPREHAFCAHAILGSEVMVIPDATADERFAQNPLVTSEPHIRFYAGAPLIDVEGNGLGTLCVIDRERRPLTAEQSQTLQTLLQTLARQIISQLEFRRTAADLASALGDLKRLHGLLPICAHCKDVRNDTGYWESVESYVQAHSEADFSHGICPVCMKLHYSAILERKQVGAAA